MLKQTGWVAGALLMAAVAVAGAQEKTVMVGGAAMYPSKDIVDNAVNSKDHTTLVAAVSRGTRRHAQGSRALHGVRADQRGLCEAARGHR